MTTTPLRLRRSIDALVLETSRGPAGPAVLLRWADAHGFAIVAATCSWSSKAAVGLAAVEAGDHIRLYGDITETKRWPWLPGETLQMVALSIEAPRQASAQRSRQ